MRERFNDDLYVNRKEAIKVWIWISLGMEQDVSQDSFSFVGLNVNSPSEFISPKRAVLSCIARLLDPLGFINPFTMYVKILFQDLWRIGIEWILPIDLLCKFQKWLSCIMYFQFFVQNYSHDPRNESDVQVEICPGSYTRTGRFVKPPLQLNLQFVCWLWVQFI